MGEQRQESSLNTEPVQGESVLGVLWGGEAPVGRTSTSHTYQGVFPSHLMDYIWLNFSQNSLKGWLIILNHHLDQYSQLSHFIFFCKEKNNVSGCPCHPTLLWRVLWNCPPPFLKTNQRDCQHVLPGVRGWQPVSRVGCGLCSGKAQGRTTLVTDKRVKSLIAVLGGVPSTCELIWKQMKYSD